jgi:hypothetical protein
MKETAILMYAFIKHGKRQKVKQKGIKKNET